MNTTETPTPRTDAWYQDYCQNESPSGTPSALVFARTLERELEDMRDAFDKQCSVTLGQMQTIRELRAELAEANGRADKAEARPAGPWRHAANQGAGSGGSIYAGRELIAACQGDADYVAVVEAHNAEVADLRRAIAAKEGGK